MRLGLKEIARFLNLPDGGYGGGHIDGVCIDSRQAAPGNLFVCLPGENVDGHDFADKAVKAGCAAVLATRPLPDIAVPVFVAEDAEKALADLAAWRRGVTKAKVICLTGTAGKTTLKDTLAAIMGVAHNVAATKGNHNNQIGLPLTILNAPEEAEYWILEAGISHAGDMDLLGSIARPYLAIILNIGPGHTEGLGGEGVAWHKSRLLKYLAPGGKALVNIDYPELVAACADTGAAPIYFSGKSGHDCQFYLEEQGPGWQKANLAGQSFTFKTPFASSFGAENTVAAAAAAYVLGEKPDNIAKGFASINLPEHRYREMSLPDNIFVVDDTYNANPLSMERALASFAAQARQKRLPIYLILGAMGELGQEAGICHQNLGRWLAAIEPAKIFWKGPYKDMVANGYAETGGKGKLIEVEKPADFVKAWQGNNLPLNNLAALFKGSRANNLEEFVAAFLEMLGGGNKTNVL